MPVLTQIMRGPAAGLTVTLTEKVGRSTMQQSAKQGGKARMVTVQEAIDSQMPVRQYLRHPIKRVISAWRYFSPNIFPRSSRIAQHAPLEKFVDAILSGVDDAHWGRQLDMYKDCNVTELYRFENFQDTWPSYLPMFHLNESKAPHPGELTYRLDELEAHYAEDLITWHGLD